MTRRILWDIGEAAILLDALVKVKEGLISRNEAILEVSRRLRTRAVKSGIMIDGVFRNIAGIRLQMSIIEYLFTGGESGIYQRSFSKVFKEAVELYKNDRGKFDLILKQASGFETHGAAYSDVQANEPMQTKQEKFHNWLSHEVTPAQLSELYVVFAELDAELKGDRVLDKSIYEVEYEWELEGLIKHISGRFNFRKLFKRGADKKIFALNLFKRYLRENPNDGVDDSYSPAGSAAVSYAQNTAPYAEIKGALPEEDTEDNSVSRDLEKSNILAGIESNSTQSNEPSEAGSSIKPPYSKPELPEEEEAAEQPENTINFNNLNYNCKSIKPTHFNYFDETEGDVSDWQYLYVQVMSCLNDEYPDVFKANRDTRSEDGALIIAGVIGKNEMKSPVQLENGSWYIYIEKSIKPEQALKNIKRMLDKCLIDYENLIIDYEEIEEPFVENAQEEHLTVGYFFGEDFISGNSVADKQFADEEAAVEESSAYEAAPEAYSETEFEPESSETAASSPINDSNESLHVLNWYLEPKLRKTKPADFTYIDESLIKVNSWTELYVRIVALLYKDFPDSLKPYIGRSFYNYGRCDLAADPNIMFRARYVGSGLYIETNLSANDISKKIKRVIEICGVDPEDITVRYRRKAGDMPVKYAPEFGVAPKTQNEPAPVQADTDYKSLYKKWAVQNKLSEKLFNTYLQILDIVARNGKFNIWEADFENLVRLRKTYADFFAFTPDHKKNILFAALWTLAEFSADYKAGNVKLGAPLVSEPDLNKSGEESSQNQGAAAQSEISPNIERERKEEVTAPLSPNSEKYLNVLEKYYENGYMPGSAISQRRFSNYYLSEYGETLPHEGALLDRAIEAAGVRIGNRILPGLTDAQNSLTADIVSYIEDILESGVTAVYLDAVFEKYKSSLAEELSIYNLGDLTSLLSGSIEKSFIIYGNYCRYRNIPADSESDVIEVMRNYAEPKHLDEIAEYAEFITADRLEKILKNHDDIINTARQTYFYAPNFPLGEEEVKQIAFLINDNLGHGLILKADELKVLIEKNLPYAAQSVEEFDPSALIKFLKPKLEDRFDFKGAGISPLNGGMFVSEKIREFARSQREFTLSELEDLMKEISAQTSQRRSAYEEAVRVSEDLFINKDYIDFNADEIDAVLENYVTEDYISIQGITIFLSFPSVGYPWTHYLLESYVYGYSKKFKLVHPSFAKSGVSGAIVRKSFPINDMPTLAADILSKDVSHGFEPDSAQEYLVRNGYLNKGMKNIEKVLAEAKLKYLENLK